MNNDKLGLPKGFNCATCGTRHQFSAYVFAHWTVLLMHTCDVCGEVVDIRYGRTVRVSAGKHTK